MDEKPDTMSRSQRRQKVITDNDRILYLMDEISRGARRVYDARVARIGLNQTQWRIIGQLLRDPALTQAEIAKKLELESATIGQAVAGLCARGLMERVRAKKDRRAWQLILTERLDDIWVQCSLVIHKRLGSDFHQCVSAQTPSDTKNEHGHARPDQKGNDRMPQEENELRQE